MDLITLLPKGTKRELFFIDKKDISRVQEAINDPIERTRVLADIFRFNTLYMITQAGSGHIGSSFSSLDIVTWLFLTGLIKPNSKDGDLYFSSKGHDVPGLYSVLTGLGTLPFPLIHKLRRLNGLPGHPDVSVPGIVANTGSLGMGISKARGMAIARRRLKKKGRIVVMTGDGELQEGQIWESLQPVANQKIGEITVIVDHNKMQSDTFIKNVSDLGDIEQKFKTFGWAVKRIDGHDLIALSSAMRDLESSTVPGVIIADTIKGKGVSFMESTVFGDNEYYRFHAGAPQLDDYARGANELLEKINGALKLLGIVQIIPVSKELNERPTVGQSPERIVDAYAEELLRLSKKHNNIVALDADLWPDGGLRPFKTAFPDRFYQCGIAEQDMVSVAGGMARNGLLPVVHSYAAFLATRANEQIYNNASEHSKIIYTATLAGVLPAGPGHSHQSVRDVSAIGSVPDLTIIQPSTIDEARLAIQYAIEENTKSSWLRLVNVPVDIPSYQLSKKFRRGFGSLARSGEDVAIVSAGPVMFAESLKATDILKKFGCKPAVYSMPWLNVCDPRFGKELSAYTHVFVVEDNYDIFGLADRLARVLSGTKTRVIGLGLKDIPCCGLGPEVLKHHALDSDEIVHVVRKHIELKSVSKSKRK